MARIALQVQPGMGLPYQRGAEQFLEESALGAWQTVWQPFLSLGGIPALEPLLDEPTPDEIRQVMDHAETVSGRPAPDLFRWFSLDPGLVDAEFAAQAVAALPFVTQACVERDPIELVTPHANPQFPNQRYLLAAPEGIDAVHAWSKFAGDGIGVKIIDVEYGWMAAHEDLANLQVEVVGGVPVTTGSDEELKHGTAVFGILAAEDNTKGVVGIAPAATVALAALRRADGRRNMPNALFRAVQRQSRSPDTPMVLLIEVGYPRPGSSTGDLPAEDEPTVPDQIQMAIQAGMTVVEGAGNGGLNLDDYVKDGRHPLARSSGDSGAIMVAGAGAGMSFTARPTSNHGSRIDCFAWGEGIRTCTPLLGTSAYADFGGTSGASAIIAGAAALVQSVAVARTGFRLTPDKLRALLANPDPAVNTPHVGPKRIGVMPNLRTIIDSIPTSP